MYNVGEGVYFFIIACTVLTLPLSFAHPSFRRISEGVLCIGLLLVLLTPLTELIRDIGEFTLPEIGGFSDEEYTRVVKEAYERGVEEDICAEFSISKDDVTVSVIGLSTADLSFDELRIVLSGRAVAVDRERVRKHLAGGLCGDGKEVMILVEYSI